MNTNKQTAMFNDLPETLRDLYSSRGFDLYIGSTQGSDFFINDPDRAARCHDAAEHGADGSTHAEHINDWREYAEQLREEASRIAWRLDEPDDVRAEEEIQAWHDRITAEIDACEQWHADNGDLHEEIG